MPSVGRCVVILSLSTLACSIATKTEPDGSSRSSPDSQVPGLAEANAISSDASSAVADAGTDGKIPSGCEKVLMGTIPSGVLYPPVYSWPAGTEKKLEDALDALLASTDSKRDEWKVERAAITLALNLQGKMIPWSRVPLSEPVHGILIPQDDPKEFITRSALRWFVANPQVFLGQSEAEEFQVVQISEKEEQCTTIKLGLGEETHEACRVRLQQKYCGLELGSDEYRYNGNVDMDVHRSSGRLWQMAVNAVPRFPVYMQATLSPTDVRAKIIGRELSLGCPGGSVQVTETATVETSLGVFVRKSSADAPGLEYRTAYKAKVTPDGRSGSLSWTLWVDGFDGTVLSTTADFICN